MNSSKENNPGSEKWWSYDTPYDIVRRRDLIMQGEAQKVRDIDEYIAFINEDMDDSYKIVTKFDENSEGILRHNLETGTVVYKRNREGAYEPHCYVTMVGAFYGDKIILDEENPVVVNSESGLGVTPSEYIRFASVDAPNTQYSSAYKYRERTFAATVRRLLSFKKGEKNFVNDWNIPWH